MYDIPETGFMRLAQVLTVIPLGKTCWWEGVRSGRFPKPVKLSTRCTAWRAEDIRELIKKFGLAGCRHVNGLIDRTPPEPVYIPLRTSLTNLCTMRRLKILFTAQFAPNILA